MLNEQMDGISSKSSFGMHTRDLTSGISLTSPDVLLPGENLLLLDGNAFGKCDLGSGTSFSTAIMTGMIAGFISASFESPFNSAYFKQLIRRSSTPLPNLDYDAQGAGIISIDQMYDIIDEP
jgi:hypothetical protein